VNDKENIFRERFMPLYPLLYRVAFSILGNEADACDAVQETMVKIWSMDADIGSIGNPQAYASRVLRTTAIDILRSISRKSDIVTDDAVTADLYVNPDDVGSVEYIRRAVDSLPSGQREVLKLSAYEGLPNNEIAAATGFTTDNVRQLLSRARKKLRTVFNIA